MTSTRAVPTSTQTAAAAGPIAGLPSPTRRRRPLLVIVGLVVALLAAALVAAVLGASTQTRLVWQTTTDVGRGEPVTTDQIEAVEVPVDATDSLLAASVESRDALTAGRIWATDLPSGQLLSDALAVEQIPIEAGRALVGVRLEPGGFPTAGLGAGDVVQVAAAPVNQQDAAPVVLVRRAEVESVVVLGDQGPISPRLVTLSVPEERAADVAASGLGGRVVLAVVP